MHPEDFGMLYKFGQLCFKGRKNGMMITIRINIHPLEIENYLLSHPNIKDGAITSLKLELHGDLPITLNESPNSTVKTSEKEPKGFTWTKLGEHYAHKFISMKTLAPN